MIVRRDADSEKNISWNNSHQVAPIAVIITAITAILSTTFKITAMVKKMFDLKL